MILLILLFICGTIVGSNNTLTNEIPNDDVDPKEHSQENTFHENEKVSEIYENAVQAYLDENWDECIEGFRRALHGYKTYKRMVTNCRKKCRTQAAGADPIFPENIDDLHFYEAKVRETLCLLTCNQEYREIAGSRALNKLPRETEQKFVDNRVYEYLHNCYYKKNRYQDAANSIFTFLVLHPEHEASVETLKHYLTLPGVDKENVVNLESLPYVTMYFKGVVAYDDENYEEAVSFFESSLRSFIETEEECRYYCEGPFDQGWHPEFVSSVANHFAYCLKCKRACTHMLNTINGDYRKDMLRSHYDYLQFSYYKLGNLKAACAAVASYLLFAPGDGTMLHNKEYYQALPKAEAEFFTPREEAVSYVKRQAYELRLLRYISEEFSAIDARFLEHAKKQKKTAEKNKEKELGKESISKKILHIPPGHSPSSLTQLTSNLSMVREGKKVIYDGERPEVKAGVYLIANEKALGGRNRYVADGFLNSTDCQFLMKLASIAAVEGDGYNENKSPHSAYERFEGITVGRIALMVYLGQVEPERLELLIKKTEAARDHVEKYFELNRHLYFTYTHLVCRTALPDSPQDRTDLSHEIHADNCLLKDQKVCSRESPAYVWRDYSAILYLNEDFQGGEFFFTADRENRESQSTIFPSCGRMVAFSAGEENLHGVRGVLKGRRCALALWFTQDKRYMEYERTLADAILKRVRAVGPSMGQDFQIPLSYEETLLGHFQKDQLLRQFLNTFPQS